MKRITMLLILSLVFFVSMASVCRTPTPVVIRDVPILDLSDDMTIEQYLYNSQVWGVDIKTYVLELINQIVNKVPYLDLRDKNKNEENK